MTHIKKIVVVLAIAPPLLASTQNGSSNMNALNVTVTDPTTNLAPSEALHD